MSLVNNTLHLIILTKLCSAVISLRPRDIKTINAEIKKTYKLQTAEE